MGAPSLNAERVSCNRFLIILTFFFDSLTTRAKGISTYSSDGYRRPMSMVFPSDGDSHRTGALQQLPKNHQAEVIAFVYSGF